MYRILARQHLSQLERFAASVVLLGFDFDGTLAPLVDDPHAARLRASTRRLLTAVARRYPVAVISGRARADVAARLGSVPVRHVSGNHGLEPWGETPAYAAAAAAWTAHLRDALAGEAGVVVEDKRYSVTVHYRAAPSRTRAARHVREVARTLNGARLIDGHESIALVPVSAPNKGDALELARQALGCDTALFVGDDETDEDVFRNADHSRVLTIRVGARRDSAAEYCIRAQEEIDLLLRYLLKVRR